MVKKYLQKAGIDVTVFQAHSAQAASSIKAALSGVTVEEILSTADWSSKGTIQKLVADEQASNHMLIWRPSLPKYNFQIVQVMQWPPVFKIIIL